MGYNRIYVPKYNFCAIIRIILEVHVVQLWIIFDKHIEIHLNDIKYLIYSKTL
jgi:hypothetical protein